MEKPVVCPNCDSFIGETGDLDVCPVCGTSLIGDAYGDWSKEESSGKTGV